MARIEALMPSALRAARAGLSATAWLNMLKVQGIAPRTSEGRALYRTAVSLVAASDSEIGAKQSEVPKPGPNDKLGTKNATGIRQTVTLLYRDRTTGHVQTTFWSVVSPKGITRSEAVKQAIEAYAGSAERYNQTFIMAVHSSARRLVPTGI